METVSVSALVLAAGKGTRMKSSQAKVLHPVLFVPMIFHVLNVVKAVSVEQTVVVIGHQKEHVQQTLSGQKVVFAVQNEQLGTGHAVLVAREFFQGKGGVVLILCGDIPLVKSQTLEDMLAFHMRIRPTVTLMTTTLDDPSNYGRVLCGADGSVSRIVEEKDASPEERGVKTINAGIYCVEKDFLFKALERVGSNNSQGEIYLTDIVEQAVLSGGRVEKFECADVLEVLGVNSRVELAIANKVLQQRKNIELMNAGVTLTLPDTILVGQSVVIGNDSLVAPHVSISGDTHIGRGCSIGACSVLVDVILGEGVKVGPFSHLDGCVVGDGEVIAPYSSITKS